MYGVHWECSLCPSIWSNTILTDVGVGTLIRVTGDEAGSGTLIGVTGDEVGSGTLIGVTGDEVGSGTLIGVTVHVGSWTTGVSVHCMSVSCCAAAPCLQCTNRSDTGSYHLRVRV